MPKTRNQKAKILYLLHLLETRTDEHHRVSMEDILDYLASNGVQAERKSIYDDIETLKTFGYDIVYHKGKKGGYFLASRQFELPELKLLADAVQASRFITSKKSEELIRKLEALTSKFEAVKLNRQLYVANRNKAVNETIYYGIDQIHTAIAGNVKIRFQYFEWNTDKAMQLRREGEYYQVSPWRLLWDDENYYLIAFDDRDRIIKHYRIDKMLNVSLTEEIREGKESFDGFDLARYSRKTFGMFAGTEQIVMLRCQKHLAGVMIDRFGSDVWMRESEKDQFLLRAEVAVSPQFFGWISGFGSAVMIESPEQVRSEYLAWLDEIYRKYKNADKV